MALAPVDRVLARVVKRDGHWLYGGAQDRDGYGAVRVGSRRDGTRAVDSAHEIVYRHFHGPIRPGMQIDHTCGVRNCVNPKHLQAVSKATNLDRRRYGRRDRT